MNQVRIGAWIRNVLIASFLFVLPTHLGAQGVETVVVGHVQVARSLAGVVQDTAGDALPGVLIEEFSSDWKKSLRSTRTDAAGAFTLAPKTGRDIYYLQLRVDGFNPLRVRVKVDRERGKELRLQMEIGT
ncbi:MAG: carboxypeptidase-like regulatory domain-containing protein [Candidatus Acidiferrales bacterium]